VAFRVAHHIVGSLVASAEGAAVGITEVDDETIRAALSASDDADAAALGDDPGIGNELRKAAGLDDALASADVTGGTAPGRVAEALAGARRRLEPG
jgi:argininosuccinate lyase